MLLDFEPVKISGLIKYMDGPFLPDWLGAGQVVVVGAG